MSVVVNEKYFVVTPLTSLTELVLSILLETFVFSPGNQEVHWILQGLQTPVAKDSPDNTPSLPLKVTFVKDRYD